MDLDRRWRLGLLAAVVALTAIAIIAPQSTLGLRLVPWVMFMVLIIPIHELGHALAGALVGHRIVLLRLGVGPQLVAFEAWGVSVQIHAVQIAGATMGFPIRPRALPRAREWIFAAGGLLANVGLYLLMRRLFGDALYDDEHHPFLAAANWANWSVILLNAVPFRMAEGTMSDGFHLATIPFWRRDRVEDLHIAAEGRLILDLGKRDPRGAEERAESLRQRHPNHPRVAMHRGMLAMNQRKYEEARQIWREGLASATDRMLVALMKNNIAWVDALLGDDADLAEADRLSGEAVVSLPDAPGIWGTRGAVLVRLGRGQEAVPLLRRCWTQTPEKAGRALTGAFLARALRQCGRDQEARQMLDQARALDPTCELLAWAADPLGNAPAPATPSDANEQAERRAATDSAVANAAALSAWRRDARILAFVAMFVLPERLGVPLMAPGLFLLLYLAIAPDRAGILALGVACAWAATVAASDQIRFTADASPPPTGAALVGIAFAVASLWLYQRARRLDPPPPNRGPLVMGIALGIFVGFSLFGIVFGFDRTPGPLGFHETLEAMVGEGFGLIVLGVFGLLSPKVWRRMAALLLLGLAAVSTVGASDWRFERFVVPGVPRDGAGVAMGDPRPAKLLRERTFKGAGSRPLASPGGTAFALFDPGDRERAPDDRKRAPIIRVGDFGTRLIELEGLAAVFLDEERLLVVRRKAGQAEDQQVAELAELRPFAGTTAVWAKEIPHLDPFDPQLWLDRENQTVFVRGYDAKKSAALALSSPARPDGVFAPIPTGKSHLGKEVSPFVSPAGAGSLVWQAPEDAKQRAMLDAIAPVPWALWRRSPGSLWLSGSTGDTLVSSTLGRLRCAHPGLGDGALWCVPGESSTRAMLVRIDLQRTMLGRVPGRIHSVRSLTMLDASHLALLHPGELSVIDVDARRGERLTLPESKRASFPLLIDGALALFERDLETAAVTISVYAAPAP